MKRACRNWQGITMRKAGWIVASIESWSWLELALSYKSCFEARCSSEKSWLDGKRDWKCSEKN